MIEVEVWRDVVGFEGLYQVSSCGVIKSLPRNTTKGGLLKTYFDKAGYELTRLSKEGKTSLILVHRAVAEAYLNNTSNFPCVNHISGVKSNNKIANLAWCTYSENMEHSFKIGLHPKGGSHYNAKLTHQNVEDIKNSDLTQRDLAKIYKISQQYVSELKRGVKRV